MAKEMRVSDDILIPPRKINIIVLMIVVALKDSSELEQ